MQNSISTETGKVWGFRGTFLWGLVILLAFALGQVIPLLGYMFVENMSITLESFNSFSTKVTTDAFLLFLSAVGGMFLVVPVVLGIAKLKKGSILKEYFSLNGFTLKVLGLAILAFVVLQFSTGLLIEAMGAKEIPNFMMNLEYPTLMTKILLVIAVVVAAPIVEEIIFRGFLLKGFSQTFMGVHGAVFVTAVLWAVIHQQYEIAYLIAIFVIGLAFGYARVLSNSLYIPMIMHALMNFLAIMGLFYAKGVF
ncbi:MAG: CAAX amino terminal protease self-immunity [uncultured Sulfurovum sp.]|uniref:CAAX amino terminal protease self-immunity n=2 Tax=uncultured Sulfurovum sp. TaxID=269237 RepID=A0A6S6UD59_9BACT|nr:MAG: CAAX amino terminal protease self-immunity [uncultured Sulfurovum sp.]